MSIFASVQNGAELQRVFGLPRRPIPDPMAPENLALAKELTAHLAKSSNPWPGTLYATQALALQEIFNCKGAVLPIRPGGGKTLTSALAFAIMKPVRPLLVVPAAMLVDTEHTWRKLEAHWHIPKFEDIKVLSYEKISTPSSGAKTMPDGTLVYPDIIKRIQPDMAVFDEVHRFGNTGAAGTRRMGRYLEETFGTIVVSMSGTLIRRDLQDAAHVFDWSLGEGSPLPREWSELQSWSDATNPRPSKGKRTDPGALLDHLGDLRQAYDKAESTEDAKGIICQMLGERILETAGVIGSADGPLAIPATLQPEYVHVEDPAIEEEYARLLDGDPDNGRPAWALPDGTLLPDATALARPLNTLSFGFVLVQDPPPPESYRMASSAWAKGVRDTIKYRSWMNLDSEFQVRDAVQRGLLPDLVDTLADWTDAKAQYTAGTGLREPPSKPIWISDEVVGEVCRWLEEGPGIVWVSWRALGDRLSQKLGLPYFGAGKVDASGRHVTRLKVEESAILSLASVGTGTDGLQRCHTRALWLCAPSEQPLARLHRPGFEGEAVENHIYLGSGSCLARFWRQVDLAANFAGRLSGNAQKLSYFDNHVPRRLDKPGRRWSTVVGKSDDVGEDA